MAGTIGWPLPGTDPRRPARFDPTGSAAAALVWQDRHVLPEVVLNDEQEEQQWEPKRDLLGSDAFAEEFVVETDPGAPTRLRFGDGEYGMAPDPVTHPLTALYRTGTGAVGNIGAGALRHVVTAAAGVASITNPMAARGGVDPEPLDRVRIDAPAAFRVQERAVTAADYAAAALRHPEVQRAVCTERWTGSWYTMFLAVDRAAGGPVDAVFEAALRAHLERFRMAGHDLEITPPQLVALEVALSVCVLPDYYRSDVEREVTSVLARFFAPDNWTFGATVYLSSVLAAVQAVDGVRYVEPVRFARLGVARSSGIDAGLLAFAALEIPRLDNDPNFSDRGTLDLQMRGGR